MKTVTDQLAAGRELIREIYVTPYIVDGHPTAKAQGAAQLIVADRFDTAVLKLLGRPGTTPNMLGITTNPQDYVEEFKRFCALKHYDVQGILD